MEKINYDEWSNKYREASADPLARFLVDRYIPTTKATMNTHINVANTILIFCNTKPS